MNEFWDVDPTMFAIKGNKVDYNEILSIASNYMDDVNKELQNKVYPHGGYYEDAHEEWVMAMPEAIDKGFEKIDNVIKFVTDNFDCKLFDELVRYYHYESDLKEVARTLIERSLQMDILKAHDLYW
jgi:hypothetical protein